MNNLVIIEGPGKRETLKKYLGAGYDVVATKGHIRDLPPKSFAVDISHNFEPTYVPMADKKDVIADLKAKQAKAARIYIATDPDREGEAIAWHVENVLGINENEPCRIEFNEISKTAVTNALKSPRPVNMDLIHAQQGRRVLDRLVGYKVSPIISKKIQSKLSAGRVQSVALKLVVDREKEIRNFKPEEYWNINALLTKGTSPEFKAALFNYKGKKYESHSEKETLAVVDYVRQQQFVVDEVKRSVTSAHAPAPFITSTLQQDALNKLGMPLKRTTMSAQQLYEGVSIPGEGKTALITYIRTDSTRVSPEAQAKAKEFIINKFGKQYAPASYNFFKTKKNAQDAHEAIRPINLEITPEDVKNSVTPDNYKLYKLIYDRFLASQMSDATYNSLSVVINAGDYGFKVTGRTPIFAGFTAVYKAYEEKEDDKEEGLSIPDLTVGDKLNLKNILKEQKFTKPPARFTEASLIKMMEEKGIGRPATYAPTIIILTTRAYCTKEDRYLVPTELGFKVVEFLEKYFKNIMDVTFTAKMEDNLDKVADGEVKWQEVVAHFYEGFEDQIKEAMGGESMKEPAQETDILCDKCGKANMVIRTGRYGKFLACPRFPECKNIHNLDETAPKKPVCVCPQCGKNVYEKKSKRGKIFYGCEGYPKCTFATWDMPINEKCPKCGKILTKKPLKDGFIIKCSDKECGYKREE